MKKESAEAVFRECESEKESAQKKLKDDLVTEETKIKQLVQEMDEQVDRVIGAAQKKPVRFEYKKLDLVGATSDN